MIAWGADEVNAALFLPKAAVGEFGDRADHGAFIHSAVLGRGNGGDKVFATAVGLVEVAADQHRVYRTDHIGIVFAVCDRDGVFVYRGSAAFSWIAAVGGVEHLRACRNGDGQLKVLGIDAAFGAEGEFYWLCRCGLLTAGTQ